MKTTYFAYRKHGNNSLRVKGIWKQLTNPLLHDRVQQLINQSLYSPVSQVIFSLITRSFVDYMFHIGTALHCICNIFLLKLLIKLKFELLIT